MGKLSKHQVKCIQALILIALLSVLSLAIYNQNKPQRYDTQTVTEFADTVREQYILDTELSIQKDETNYTNRIIVNSDNVAAYDANSIITHNGISVLSFDTYEKSVEAKNELAHNNIETEFDYIIYTTAKADTSKNPTSIPAPENDTITDDSKITVAVIDTGYSGSYKNRVLDIINISTESGNDDTNGHGTAMADIILSTTSSNVQVLPIKIADSKGLSSLSQLYAAIITAVDNGADIINISMTATSWENSDIISNACVYAEENGVKIVASAGNESEPAEFFIPANIESVITVGSVTKDMTPANYSNHGDILDFVTYGAVSINGQNLYGTSISSAIVTAQLANNNCDYNELKKTAQDILDTGKDNQTGYGFIDIAKEKLTIIEDELSNTTFKESLLGADWKSMSNEDFNNLINESSEYVAALFIKQLSKEDKELAISKSSALSGYFSKVTNITEDENTATLKEYDTYVEYLEQLPTSIVRVQAEESGTKIVWLYHDYSDVRYNGARADVNNQNNNDFYKYCSSVGSKLEIQVTTGKANDTTFTATLSDGDYRFLHGVGDGKLSADTSKKGGQPDCAVKNGNQIHCNFTINKNVNQHDEAWISSKNIAANLKMSGIQDNNGDDNVRYGCTKDETKIKNIGVILPYNLNNYNGDKLTVYSQPNKHTKKGEVAATCTDTGLKTLVCDVCGGGNFPKTIPIDSNAHDYSGAWYDGGDGKHYQHCSRDNTHPAGNGTAHTHSNLIETKKHPNCLEGGINVYQCTACTSTTTVNTNALGHAPGAWYDGGDGNHYQDCTRDGCNAKNLNGAAHTYEWKHPSDLSCIYEECTVCKAIGAYAHRVQFIPGEHISGIHYTVGDGSTYNDDDAHRREHDVDGNSATPDKIFCMYPKSTLNISVEGTVEKGYKFDHYKINYGWYGNSHEVNIGDDYKAYDGKQETVSEEGHYSFKLAEVPVEPNDYSVNNGNANNTGGYPYTIHAVAAPIEYELDIDFGGGNSSWMSNIKYEEEIEIGDQDNITGYYPAGWLLTVEKGSFSPDTAVINGQSYAFLKQQGLCVENADGSIYISNLDGDKMTMKNLSVEDGSELEMEVQYEKNNYTILYFPGDTNDDVGIVTTQTATYDDWVTLKDLDDYDVKGRHYKITLNPNTGTKSTAGTVISTADTYYCSKDSYEGYLEYADSWIQKSTDSEYTAGGTYNSPNLATGETDNASASLTANWLDTVIDLPEPTLDGYEFVGWYTKAEGGEKEFYYNDKNYASTTRAALKDGELTIFPGTKEYDLTLYAHWKPIQYKIKFELDGGTGREDYDYTERYVNYDTGINVGDPLKTGYQFKGWTLVGHNIDTAEITGEHYYGMVKDLCGTNWSDGYIDANANTTTDNKNYPNVWIRNLRNTSSSYHAVTLQAQWEANTYYINYNKGQTDDTENPAATSTTCRYDSNVTFSNKDVNLLGRSYEINFNSNFPASPAASTTSTYSISQSQITGNLDFDTSVSQSGYSFRNLIS